MRRTTDTQHKHTRTHRYKSSNARRHKPRRRYDNAALKILIFVAVIFVVDFCTVSCRCGCPVHYFAPLRAHTNPSLTARVAIFNFFSPSISRVGGRTRQRSCRTFAEMPTSDALYPGFTHKSDLFYTDGIENKQ